MFKTKSFMPYLMVVFFNSFVDLGHKILLQDTLYQTVSSAHYTVLSSILNALILLPYILIFTPSGFISDRFSKTRVMQITAIAALPLLLLITVCYYQGWFWAAYSLTLLLGFQSAINSPAKYGYIKEIFGKANIAQANAYVQTTAIIAILAGTFIFTLLFSHMIGNQGIHTGLSKSHALTLFAPLGFLLALFSLFEIGCTFLLSKKPAADPDSQYHAHLYIRGHYLKNYLSVIAVNRVILICVIGLSLLWGVNQVLLANYGAYLKTYVAGAGPVFAQGSLALGGIGILLGALYAGRVSKGFVETGLIPVAAIGLSIGLLLLAHLTSKFWIGSLFLAYGFFAGMLIVPLNALIQFNAKPKQLGKVLAGNNFIQNIVMFAFLLLSTLGAVLGETSKISFHILFIIFLIGSITTILLLPQSLIRYSLYFLISKIYRIDVIGLNNLPSSGGVLLLGNHTSFLDWAVIQIACPRPVRFVMERSIYERWYLKWLLSRLRVIPISGSASKNAIERVNTALKNSEVVALFPEGCLSRNGQLGEFHAGFERAVTNTNASIIPFYLRGLWGTMSSYATSYYKALTKVKHRHVSISFGTPMADNSTAAAVKQAVTALSVTAWRQYAEKLPTLPSEWIRRSKQMGNVVAIFDSMAGEISHYKLMAIVLHLAKHLKPRLATQQNIGLLLPTSAGGIAANLATLVLGKTLVNLNYTAGANNVAHAIKAVNLKTIITSKKFVERLEKKGLSLADTIASCRIIYIENLFKGIKKINILKMLWAVKLLPLALLELFYLQPAKPTDIAAILFSSGSEGTPKGVMLSHQNVLSNIKQVISVFNLDERDVVFSCLPLFHAFGLTVTSFMPIIEGIPAVCHPDPTDAKMIGRLIFQHNVTVMCSTSSILGLYVRNPKMLPPMLESLRFVIAGAEKLSPKVYDAFKQKFNIGIYEGYGTTELSPVASSNLPDILNQADWKVHKGSELGSVGLPLPGTAFKIVDPVSCDDMPLGESGLILVSGPQLMQGYLNNPEKTNEVIVTIDHIRWYKTGDKGFLNTDGFLHIVDRYSRFAKIGGEMISLSALEHAVLSALNLDNADVIAVNIPDDKKGEKIVLLHNIDIEASELKTRLMEAGIENIMLPADYYYLKELPKLGSGKKDFVGAKKWVLSKMS